MRFFRSRQNIKNINRVGSQSAVDVSIHIISVIRMPIHRIPPTRSEP